MQHLRVSALAVLPVVLLLMFAPVPGGAQQLDQYGGYTNLPAPGGATGFFRVAKIGNGWTFVSPEGNQFWMRSVYVIGTGDGGTVADQILKTVYGSDNVTYTTHANHRLLGWGFNTIGPYSLSHSYPVPTNGRSEGNPVKMPFVRLLNVSWYGTLKEPGTDLAKWGLAPAPFKTLLAGAVDPTIYSDWPGHVPDVFDPNFETFARNAAADLRTPYRDTVFTEKTSTGGAPHPSLVNTPWLIGTTPDDVDMFFGLGGPGPEVPGADGTIHPHLGWVVAITRPTQTENTKVGQAFGDTRTVTYSDPIVYSKRAWRDFLIAKYGTIDKLNAAWGSTYTTFESDGGWPTGRGLLDENGSHAWIGKDFQALSTAAPAVRVDLDAFLEVLADHYFKVVTEAVRAATPNHLAFGPAMLNGHKGLSRRQILRAAGRYCDVIEVNQNPDKLELIGITYAETGRPMFSWVGHYANPDSAMYAYPNPSSRGFLTQQDRGAQYQQIVSHFLTTSAPNGDLPMIGLAWWEYMDKTGEQTNWGLVSPRNNAYDGVQAVVAPGTDPWGYPTGGEDRNFGNFLGPVMAAHDGIPRTLAARTSNPPPPPPGNTLTVSITDPNNGATVGGTVSVKASASTAASRINLLLDGNIIGLYSGTTASFKWDTSQDANGQHRWVAKAFDAAGSVQESPAVDVTVKNSTGDGSSLTVQITAPASGTIARRTRQTITAAATGASVVTFFVDGSLQCTSTSAPYTCPWHVPAVKGRTYHLRAEASDKAGNVITSPVVSVTAH